MARKARKAVSDGIYHVIQNGNTTRCLFESDLDREVFLALLIDTKKKYDFKLYAYCLEDSNTYHLLLHVNGGDLSKIMKSINIAYAMYIKCEHRLFKDRYKSIRIESDCDFEKVKDSVICNQKEGSCFNTDSTICESENPFTQTRSCTKCIKDIEEALKTLDAIAASEKTTVQRMIADKDKRNALIKYFRKHSLLSLKDLGVLMGGLSESMICKVLKSK